MRRRIADIEYEQMLQIRYTIAQHRHPDGLDRSAYLLLSRIGADGPRTIAELSEIFRLDASTVQRQTRAAMTAGLVIRIDDPDGGIAKKFTLTELGTQRLSMARARSIEALENILTDWPDEEVSTFADLLHRFNLDIERYSTSRRPGA